MHYGSYRWRPVGVERAMQNNTLSVMGTGGGPRAHPAVEATWNESELNRSRFVRDVVVEVITLTLTSYFSRALLTPLKLTLNTR